MINTYTSISTQIRYSNKVISHTPTEFKFFVSSSHLLTGESTSSSCVDSYRRILWIDHICTSKYICLHNSFLSRFPLIDSTRSDKKIISLDTFVGYSDTWDQIEIHMEHRLIIKDQIH